MSIAQADPVPAPPIPSPARSTKPRRELWTVLILTAFSTIICFNRLSHPALLIDEAFTYWRTCGTFGQMLDTLREDAFVPLHYELLSWIRQGMPLGFGHFIVPGGILLSPDAIRFPSALAGALMTPVMYFLARQFFNRRTAVIAAIFITCSAYGMFFSRYAKMYAGAWMLETLSIACFAWWMNSRKRLAWLCWIAAGIAASSYHAVTLLVVLPIPLLY
jgi:dolichyl-phosphate-mannose--protein O-mannosyl transferase